MRFSGRKYNLSFLGVLVAGVIACVGISHGALHIIQGSGTTSNPGESDKTDIMLGATFTFEMIFDDAVTVNILDQGSRAIIIYENPVVSFKVDGLEQMGKFDGMKNAGFSSQISYMDRVDNSVRKDLFRVDMPDANIIIDGAITVGYLNGGPYDLNLLNNLVQTQMAMVQTTYSEGRIDQRTAPQLLLVPEPSSMALFGLGIIGISLRRKRH